MVKGPILLPLGTSCTISPSSFRQGFAGFRSVIQGVAVQQSWQIVGTMLLLSRLSRPPASQAALVATAILRALVDGDTAPLSSRKAAACVARMPIMSVSTVASFKEEDLVKPPTTPRYITCTMILPTS